VPRECHGSVQSETGSSEAHGNSRRYRPAARPDGARCRGIGPRLSETTHISADSAYQCCKILKHFCI